MNTVIAFVGLLLIYASALKTISHMQNQQINLLHKRLDTTIRALNKERQERAKLYRFVKYRLHKHRIQIRKITVNNANLSSVQEFH